jgi:hypothetical protein
MIKAIAILGGTDFVGCHLANRLTKARYPLKVLTPRRERHRELLVPDWFDQTLPGVDFPIALLFLDVDLEASLDTCVRNLWPYLIDGGCLFTDEGIVHRLRRALLVGTLVARDLRNDAARHDRLRMRSPARDLLRRDLGGALPLPAAEPEHRRVHT